jgi:hypothetical protein
MHWIALRKKIKKKKMKELVKAEGVDPFVNLAKPTAWVWRDPRRGFHCGWVSH